MPGSLSQPRTCYPPAACSDLVNEFISSVATAGSASPHSDTQPVSFCRVGVKSESKLSAVAPAKQVYSIVTPTLLLMVWRVGACRWDLFFFSTWGCHQTYSKMSTFQELCKTGFEDSPWTQKTPQPEEEKIGFHMTTEIQYSFFPSLSFWINLFVCPLFLLFLWASRWKRCYWKMHFLLVSFRQQSCSHNEPNHSKAKMEIFASELIRQGIARPK